MVFLICSSIVILLTMLKVFATEHEHSLKEVDYTPDVPAQSKLHKSENMVLGADEYGIIWRIDNKRLVGIFEGKEVAYYKRKSDTYSFVVDRESAHQFLGEPIDYYSKWDMLYSTTVDESVYEVFDRGSYFLTVFYDTFTLESEVLAFLKIDRQMELEKRGYYGYLMSTDFETCIDVVKTNETILFYLVNEERKARGLPELTYLVDAFWSARNYASSMAWFNYFSHQSHINRGPMERFLSRSDEPISLILENLAGGVGAFQAHYLLMASEGHRTTILNNEVTHLGVGGWFNIESDLNLYFVQHFIAY